MPSSPPESTQKTGAEQGCIILHLGDPDRHFWLVRSVARVMGISLGEALLQGAMEQDACRRMIDRCRTCAVVRVCHDWLAESSGRADAPPPGCVISTDLNRLKCMTRSKGAH